LIIKKKKKKKKKKKDKIAKMENNMKILWYFSLISAILMAIGGITEYKCINIHMANTKF